jgi:hypothetical protein
MTKSHETMPPPTPKHLWVVGVVGLLWSSFGALDYFMTQTRNESYMANFTPEQLEYFYGFPVWMVAAWATAIWASVFGSVALLLRSRWAVGLFAVALLGMIVSSLYTYGLSEGIKMMGGVGQWLFTIAIWVVGIGLYFYARAQQRQGVLR